MIANDRQERMAAFIARGGARPPGAVRPKKIKAPKAPKAKKPRQPRAVKPIPAEYTLGPARKLLAQAMVTKSWVEIGPRLLADLIALAEHAETANDPASQMARLLDRLPTYDPAWPDDFRAMWMGWADQFWKWAHPPPQNSPSDDREDGQDR